MWNVIHAESIRQGDRILIGSALRTVLATCCPFGHSFARLSVEGENCSVVLPRGRAMYVWCK